MRALGLTLYRCVTGWLVDAQGCLVLLSATLLVMPSYGYSESELTSFGNNNTPVNPHALRDPTQPSNFKPSENNGKGSLRVRSILIGKTRRIALINDTFVGIGDRIGTATILSIKKDSVIVLDAGQSITLYLFENDIRK
jgi:MSHA biogenesis protein MshK